MNMNNVIWDTSPQVGLDVGYHTNNVDGQVTLLYHQDPAYIISQNKFRRLTEDNSKRRRSGKFYQVAEIPLGVVMRWKTELGVDIHDMNDWKKVVELLHDPEWWHLRVSETKFATKQRRTLFTGPRMQASHPLGATHRRPNVGGLIHSGVF